MEDVLLSLSCSYNQQEEDFASLREYNDYLEEVETIGGSASLSLSPSWHALTGSVCASVQPLP